MLKTFAELDMAQFTGKIVILDIDGTLMPDSADNLPVESQEALRTLTHTAHVYLCSNARPDHAIDRISKEYGIERVQSRRMKPSLRILDQFDESERRRLVVIGDKYLTDGLLALRANACFIKVQRLRGGESLWVRARDLLHDIVGPVVYYCWSFAKARIIKW